MRDGLTDFVGLGRMVLSYPELPADVLAGRPLQPQRHLPHLQRLHDRAAQRPGLGLLSRSTRSTRSIPTRRRLKASQRRHAGMSTHERSRGQALAAVTAFVSLFAIVGLALYGLPFFYDFMVKEFGWTRAAGHLGQRLSASS